MNNESRQKQEELAVFKNFMTVCEYPIVETSIVQNNPPEPDISCKLANNNSLQIEITNCVDSQLAQKMNDKKLNDNDRGGFCNSEPIEDVIFSKNRKLKNGNYNLSGDRFELLVYLGLTPFWPHWSKSIPAFLEGFKSKMLFDRIWIFRDDQIDPKILWDLKKAV